MMASADATRSLTITLSACGADDRRRNPQFGGAADHHEVVSSKLRLARSRLSAGTNSRVRKKGCCRKISERSASSVLRVSAFVVTTSRRTNGKELVSPKVEVNRGAL